MTIYIRPETIAAFESEAVARELRDFVTWWNARLAVLGAPITLQSGPSLMEAAKIAGAEIGIKDDEDNRLFLQAAAQRLMPSPTGEQWLLAADAILAPADDDQRLAQLVAIARMAG